MTAAFTLAIPENEARAVRLLVRELIHSGAPQVQQLVHRVLPEPSQITDALRCVERLEAALLSAREPCEEAK